MAALERELIGKGHRVGREVYVPVKSRGAELGRQRLDMVVDQTVVVEAKATEVLHLNATRQLFAYLRATNLEVGILLHFGPRPRFRRVACFNMSKRLLPPRYRARPSPRAKAPTRFAQRKIRTDRFPRDHLVHTLRS